jgi:RNA polymerase sigma-70 factor (ECF subfamily)
VSSSFPAARFPAVPISQKRVDSRSVAETTPEAPKELSDEVLLVQISTGDQEALGVLFRRYARLVWSVAERIVRNKAEADDLLQDVFILIQRRASVFDSSKGAARSLIVHMTYQRALSRRKYLNSKHYQASEEAGEGAAEIAAPAIRLYDESIEAHFGRERLREALQELSEDQRKTLRLYFFEGYTLDEIGECLGQSVGNVKHHYYRGLQGLRRYLPKS